jgi:hypothetical protein
MENGRVIVAGVDDSPAVWERWQFHDPFRGKEEETSVGKLNRELFDYSCAKSEQLLVPWKSGPPGSAAGNHTAFPGKVQLKVR